MRWIGYRRIFSIVAVLLAVVILACVNSRLQSTSAETNDAAWISLSIEKGKAAGSLDFIAGEAYVFQRITLAVDNRGVKDNGDALDWLRRQSDFSSLDWNGVRESRAYWRNFHESRPAADVYSHVFEGAKWMDDANGLELAVLDSAGNVVGTPLRLTNGDFLNRQKQQDFDMIKAEYRYENFARHKDLASAKIKHAIAKIVFAVQTDLAKQLVIPASARSLRVVWDKKPQQPYIFPIRLMPPAYNYGGKLHVTIEPEKPVYVPGDVIRATFTLTDQKGQPLKFSEAEQNGLRQINIHLDGPVQEPTFFHEEWLSEFGERYSHHVRAPALGLGTAGQSANTALPGPPLDASGAKMVVDLHVPANLTKDKFGSYEIGATIRRSYASQDWTDRLDKHIQVGQTEHTEFEKFGCENCHAPNSPMDVGLLIPPMAGIEKLQVDSIQSCVMCHDNSRNGSRRLSRFLHIIHENRDQFPVAKDQSCGACHLTAGSIKKGTYP